MSKPKNQPKDGLDEAIEDVLEAMKDLDPTYDDYAVLVEHLDKLHKIKTYKKEDRVSKDTMLMVGANLAGIVMIMSYEKAHVITSKAFGMLLKAR